MVRVNIPTFKLNNGREIPALGFGTWLGMDEKDVGDKTSNQPFEFDFSPAGIPKMIEALSYAIDIGYRSVDTAHLYRVEPEVAKVIEKKIKDGVVKREELFVTTKVWQHFHREADVEVSVRGSLRRLKLDYIDLVLMHWPMSISQEGKDEKIDYLETWRGFESVLAKGLVKGIGVSNFNVEQMDRLLKNCKVKPVTNQIEVNLNLGQKELVDFCQSHNVLITAYSPFGTMVPSRSAPNSPEPKLNNPTMVAIANKHGKTVTQVTLRYLVNIPTFKLNNGREIPALGFGTWLGMDEKDVGDKTSNQPFEFDFSPAGIPKMIEALSYAIDIGYRSVDTAHLYRVEPEVAKVIEKKIKDGVVKREELFVTTKVWQHFHREADVEVSVRGSLRRLKLDYIDLVLMHWPMSISQEGKDEKIDYLETWRGFESVLAKGLVKGIGVSNFNVEQMDRLLKNCKVKPVTNQIEVNLNLGQKELVDFCQSHNVLITAYSPFGTMVPSRSAPNSPEPKLNNPTMVAIANKHGKTVTQVTLRYLYERGMVSVPKTVTNTRVVENASIFDFNLDKDDIEALAKFDNGYRTVRPFFFQDFQNYPFDKIPEKMDIPKSLLVWKNGINLDID